MIYVTVLSVAQSICGRKQLSPNLKYFSSIFLEELRKTIKFLSEDSQYPGRDWNQVPPKYKSEVLPLEPICDWNQLP
jgi:hypothetical protein